MTTLSARLSQAFAHLGHAYMHLLVALFLTIVLGLEKAWQREYADLISLWTVGAFLVGVFAPLAGLLGDKWSTPGMMVVFFTGSGAAAIACGLSDGPLALAFALGERSACSRPFCIPWAWPGWSVPPPAGVWRLACSGFRARWVWPPPALSLPP
jgi:hypothetical protein